MVIDILFAVTMLLAIFKGWSRGIIAAFFSLLALILGAAAALKLSAVLADYLHEHLHWQYSWLPVLSFILIFIAVALLVRLVAKLVESLAQLAFLGWVNRLAGILSYLILYTILFSIALWLSNQVYLLTPTLKSQSFIYAKVAPLGPYVIEKAGVLIPWFRDVFQELQHFFEMAAIHLPH